MMMTTTTTTTTITTTTTTQQQQRSSTDVPLQLMESVEGSGVGGEVPKHDIMSVQPSSPCCTWFVESGVTVAVTSLYDVRAAIITLLYMVP